MTDHEVLEQVRGALSPLHMRTPIEQIMATGNSRRRRRLSIRAVAGVLAVGVVAAVAVTASVPSNGHQSHSIAKGSVGPRQLLVRTVAYTVTKNADGTVTVWTKQAYFQDPAGLQAALRHAGFPVLIKVGEFCRGPHDDGSLDPSGQGPGVRDVMTPGTTSNGTVTFTFDPKAMPARTELFIGYLSPSQLAVTHGRPGSVERLIPTNTALICTTKAPPPNNTQP